MSYITMAIGTHNNTPRSQVAREWLKIRAPRDFFYSMFSYEIFVTFPSDLLWRFAGNVQECPIWKRFPTTKEVLRSQTSDIFKNLLVTRAYPHILTRSNRREKNVSHLLLIIFLPFDIFKQLHWVDVFNIFKCIFTFRSTIGYVVKWTVQEFHSKYFFKYVLL